MYHVVVNGQVISAATAAELKKKLADYLRNR